MDGKTRFPGKSESMVFIIITSPTFTEMMKPTRLTAMMTRGLLTQMGTVATQAKSNTKYNCVVYSTRNERERKQGPTSDQACVQRTANDNPNKQSCIVTYQPIEHKVLTLVGKPRKFIVETRYVNNDRLNIEAKQRMV